MITIRPGSKDQGLSIELQKMFSRRGKSFLPTIGVIAVTVIGIYGYFMYSELQEKYEKTDRKLSYLTKRQVSLKSQLQVVYEHRSKLEAALLKQRTDHRATKHEFVTKMKECDANMTRAKQEATNRFNALDTEHRMQKARHEEVTADFQRLEQQYVRLSKDHQKIVAGHKEDFEKLKDAKEHESKSLQERVETLYKEKSECDTEQRKYFGYYQSERTERLKLRESNEALKKTLGKVKEEGFASEQVKMDIQKKLDKAEEKIEELEKKIQQYTEDSKEKEASMQAHPIQTATKRLQPNQDRLLSTKAPVHKPTDLPTHEQTKEALEDGRSEEVDDISKKNALLSKPSDKVQGIIIGKKEIDPEAVNSKKEDSIKDQYEVSEQSERGEDKMLEGEKTQSPSEVNFQDLVRNNLVLDGSKGLAGKRDETGEDAVKEAKEKGDYRNEAGENAGHDRVKRPKGHKSLMKALIRSKTKEKYAKKGVGNISEQKDESPKREISQKSHEISRESDEILRESHQMPRESREKNEELDAIKKKESSRKKGDDGASFLLKQQKLLARPKLKIEKEVAEADSEEKSVIDVVKKVVPVKVETAEENATEENATEEKATEEKSTKEKSTEENAAEEKSAGEKGTVEKATEDRAKEEKATEESKEEANVAKVKRQDRRDDVNGKAEADKKKDAQQPDRREKDSKDEEKDGAEKPADILEKNLKDSKEKIYGFEDEIEKTGQKDDSSKVKKDDNEDEDKDVKKDDAPKQEKKNNDDQMNKNLVRNQVKPPHPIERIKNVLQPAKLKAKHGRQLQPPAKNINQNNRPEASKQDEKKTAKDDNNNNDQSEKKPKGGKQLHAPIRGPQTNKRKVKESGQLTKKDSFEVEVKKDAKIDNDANAADQPQALTLEDDENGDQDLDKENFNHENADPEDEERAGDAENFGHNREDIKR